MDFFNGKISLRQLTSILILEIFSTSFLAIPKLLYKNTRQDSFLIVLISGLIAYASLTLFIFLYKKTYSKTFKEFLYKLFGKVGGLILVLFIAKNILFISFELNYFLKLVQDVLLTSIPKPVILFIFLFSSYYFAKKGIETRGRLAEFLIISIVLIFILFFIITSLKADFTNIFPMYTSLEKPDKVFMSVYIGLMAFSGLEYLFILVPFLKKKEKLHRSSLIVVVSTTIFISLLTLLTIAVFNKSIMRENYPVLMLLNSVSLPFGFIERQDSLVFLLWIIGSFFTVSAGVFYSTIIFRNFTNKNIKIEEILAVVTFFLTLYFSKKTDVMTLGYLALTLNILYLVVLPIISAFVYAIKKALGKNFKEVHYENN